MPAKKAPVKKVSKKTAQHKIELELNKATENLKPELGEKKIKKRIKKAAKLITRGLSKKGK